MFLNRFVRMLIFCKTKISISLEWFIWIFPDNVILKRREIPCGILFYLESKGLELTHFNSFSLILLFTVVVHADNVTV